MTTAAWIALLWLAFGTTHIGLTSSRVRPRSAARFGADGHRAVFSAVALAFAIPNLMLYFTNRHAGAQLWAAPEGAAAGLLYAGTAIAAVLLALSVAQPSPTMMTHAGDKRVHGVLRISRHPMLVGFALLGLCQLLLGGFATDVAFFGGLAAYSVAGGLHQDRRYLREGVSGYRAFYERTSFFPFWPTGRVESRRENGPQPSGSTPVSG